MPGDVPLRSPTLVLASGSPRRRSLLRDAGIRFQVLPAGIPEHAAPDEAAEALARRLAAQKAWAVAGRLGPDGPRWVLGADTIVVLDGHVLGKPRDPRHAEELLARLAGRTHRVITGVSLVLAGARGQERGFAVETAVHMRDSTPAERRAYVATGEPLDKAGAYAVQGRGRDLVERLEGSETNVIGLPMDETLAALREVGIAP